jgi:hypothetical protein
VVQRDEVADNHAETVEQRGWIAYGVLACDLQRFSYVKAVIEDVVVAQGDTLWVASGARGELDVYGVITVHLRFSCQQLWQQRVCRHHLRHHIAPQKHPRLCLVT